MKKNAIAAIVLLVFGIGAAVALRYADKSRQTFNAFCGAIRVGDYAQAQTYVADGLLDQNSNGVWMVHMINGDMPAECFALAHVRKVCRSKDRDVVIFSMSSRGDMAHIERGKITYVKCP